MADPPLSSLLRRAAAVLFVVVAAATATAGLGACGSDSDSATNRTVTVLAAASLTKAFTALAEQFEADNEGTRVELGFAASSELVTQIEQGAEADVFASADEANIDKVIDAGEADGAPVAFARNRLEIAVERGNPAGIRTLADLADPELVVVLCAPEVPCGKYADQILDTAGVTVRPASREDSVSSTLGKVELGEADAAIVYASDVATSDKVDGVVIPDSSNVVTTLPMIRLKAGTNDALAQRWIDFVLARRATLVSDFGFLPLP